MYIKITREIKEERHIIFSDIDSGELFLYDNDIFMKLPEVYESVSGILYNAIRITSGELHYFLNVDEVDMINPAKEFEIKEEDIYTKKIPCGYSN